MTYVFMYKGKLIFHAETPEQARMGFERYLGYRVSFTWNPGSRSEDIVEVQRDGGSLKTSFSVWRVPRFDQRELRPIEEQDLTIYGRGRRRAIP